MRVTQSVGVAIILGCMFLSAGFAGSLAEERARSMPVLVSRHGTVKLELRKLRPEAGYVADVETWEELWRNWRGTEQVLAVDFREAIVLVTAGNDPNPLRVTAAVDQAGALQLNYVKRTLLYFDPKECFYQFALIRREGIKSIGGKEIEKPRPQPLDYGPFRAAGDSEKR